MLSQIIDLSPYYGVISITGQEAHSFLQGQLTCDVRETSSDSLQLGGFCTPQGRLRALFKLFKQADTFYLELPKSLLPPVLTILKKYALFSKVKIQEETDTQVFGWLGPSLPDLNDLDLVQVVSLNVPGQPPRWQWIGPSSAMTALWQSLIQQSTPVDFNEWLLLDIRQGIPDVWLETTEHFFPHHLKLNHLEGISFTKGCYCGQEIIARMHYRGNIKRGMVLGIFPNRSEPLIPGSEILLTEDQSDTAKVISAVSHGGQTEALLEIPLRLLPDSLSAQTLTVRINSVERQALIISRLLDLLRFPETS